MLLDMSGRNSVKNVWGISVSYYGSCKLRGKLAARSAWLANWSMKPLTPSWLLDCVAGVEGMPYKSCKHAGVIAVLHVAGTAFATRAESAGARDSRRAETTGTSGFMSAKLWQDWQWVSLAVMRMRASTDVMVG